MLSSLNDIQEAIIKTSRMRFSTTQTLRYLHDHRFKISERTYYREKARLKKMRMERLDHIAKIGFVDHHLLKIRYLQLSSKIMWQKYDKEKDPWKKCQILVDIVHIEPALTEHYKAIGNLLKSTKSIRKLEYR